MERSRGTIIKWFIQQYVLQGEQRIHEVWQNKCNYLQKEDRAALNRYKTSTILSYANITGAISHTPEEIR